MNTNFLSVHSYIIIGLNPLVLWNMNPYMKFLPTSPSTKGESLSDTSFEWHYHARFCDTPFDLEGGGGKSEISRRENRQPRETYFTDVWRRHRLADWGHFWCTPITGRLINWAKFHIDRLRGFRVRNTWGFPVRKASWPVSLYWFIIAIL